jgi:uncharacterized membrane protein YfcA
MFEWYVYLLAIAAGILAGIINTLAGSGSLVTLPMLIFLGLPPSVANGTNRVGVIVQNIVGIGTFRRKGALDATGTAVRQTTCTAVGNSTGLAFQFGPGG